MPTQPSLRRRFACALLGHNDQTILVTVSVPKPDAPPGSRPTSSATLGCRRCGSVRQVDVQTVVIR